MQHERTSAGRVTAASEPGTKVAVLVSVGQHPITGRNRRAEQDARAIEMALSRFGADAVSLVHAGDASGAGREALRAYLGMGLKRLDLVSQPAGADVLPALEAHVRTLGTRVLLCGARSETGEGSGMLPYLLGQRLGWSVATAVAEIEAIDGDWVTLLQALPRGQRRRLKLRLPAIVCVDSAAAAPRQSAFGPARRGEIRVVDAETEVDREQAEWTVKPARKRPKRLKIVKAASARDRFKAAAAKAEGGGGQVLNGVSPEDGAAAVFKLLVEEGVLRR